MSLAGTGRWCETREPPNIEFRNPYRGVRAHLGRVLAFRLPEGQGTRDQRALVREALSYRLLGGTKESNAKLRGLCRTFEQMAKYWAADAQYVPKVMGWLAAIKAVKL